MPPLNMNIRHGDLKVGIRHGGGGGPDVGALIGPAVIIGIAVGVAVIIATFAWLVITAGVILAAVRLWILHRKNVATLAITAAFAREHEIREQKADARLAAQRAHELEVARVSASAPASQGAIDLPAIAAIVAAAVAGAQLQPQAVRVLRGEVER